MTVTNLSHCDHYRKKALLNIAEQVRFASDQICLLYLQSIVHLCLCQPMHSCKWMFHIALINPLTTDDECTSHATLATCYQLAQSVLKIGFALAKKAG